MTWENSGGTPTKNATTRSKAEHWPTDLPKGFTFAIDGAPPVTPFSIGPRGTFRSSVIVSMDVIEKVRNKESHLFVWGETAYNDLFLGTPKRLTEFCVEVLNITTQDITDPLGRFTWDQKACNQHNCYDQDCSDYPEKTK